MKKLRFGLQVFVLIAAFPVLFITGISYGSSGSLQSKEQPGSIRKEVKAEMHDRFAGCNTASFYGTPVYINCLN